MKTPMMIIMLLMLDFLNINQILTLDVNSYMSFLLCIDVIICSLISFT
jgi:hypothetical protein